MKKVIIYTVLCYCWLNGLCQDPIFNNPTFGLTYLNPAYAGGTGEATINAQSRIQYSPISGTFNYNTASFNIGCPTTGLGLGIHGFNSTQGEGFLTTNNLYFLTSVNRKIGRFSNLTGGLQVGVGQHRLDWDKLTFTSQLDPYFGKVRSQSNIFFQQAQSNMFTDLSAGIRYRVLFGKRKRVQNSNPYLTLGLAVFHINEPSESFFEVTTNRQRRYSAHAFFYFVPKASLSYRSKANKPVSFAIGLNYQQQNPVRTSIITVHTFPHEHLVLFGGFKRQNFMILDNENWDSFVAGFSFDLLTNKKSFRFEFGYSVDILAFELGRGNSMITHEIGLTTNFLGNYLCLVGGRKRSKKRRIQKNRQDACFWNYYEDIKL